MQGYLHQCYEFLAERQLSAADLANPEMSKEKIDLTFQGGPNAGPPQLDALNMPLPKWVDTFNSFKKSRTYGGDGIDWNEEMRKKAYRDQQGERNTRYDLPVWQRWKSYSKGSKAAPPASASGHGTYASSSSTPPWEEEWFTSAPPEGIVTVEVFGKDYDAHEIKFMLWADRRDQYS